MRRILGSAFVLLLAATRVDAQVCTGFASFSNGPVRLAGDATFHDGAKSFGASATYGKTAMFGGVSLGSVSYDNVDGSTFLIGGHGGYQVQVGQTKKTQVCPIVALTFGSGPNDVFGPGVDMTTRDLGIGFSTGMPIATSSGTTFVPFGSIAFANTSLKLDDGTNSVTDSESYGIIQVGSGIVMGEVFTFRPNVNIPVGLKDAKMSFGVILSLNVGK